MKLEVGSTYSTEKIVRIEDTAASFGSGLLEVFATPAMIAMMENTCLQLVQPAMELGFTTVGTAVDIKHLKATPKGDVVNCAAILTEVVGKKLIFSLEVKDRSGLVGVGFHKRYIINKDEFMNSLK